MRATISIPKELLSEMTALAEQEYPNECCGFLLGPTSDAATVSRVMACKNAQNQYHEMDPERFPRDAKTAYFIEPRDLLRLEKETRNNRESLRMIYHSHVNVGVYFSEEDKKQALHEGEPVYPGVDYLVLSVREQKVDGFSVFRWNAESRDFVEVRG